MHRPALAAIALLQAAGPARAEIVPRAMLHLRVTESGGLPDGSIRYDEGSRTFTFADYLAPARPETYGSAFASLALDGHHLDDDLRWTLAVDTGELRRSRFPRVVPVCLTALGTGVSEPGSAACPASRVVVPVESTARRPAEATSNGRPLREEAEATAFVREAFVAGSFGRAGFATVRAGRKRITVGDGFVYDDYATGLEAALDLGAIGPRWALSAALFQPSRDLPHQARHVSPMFALRADFLPSLFEHAGIFLAGYRDRSGGAAEIFRGAFVERLAQEYLRDPPDQQRRDTRRLAVVQSAPMESDARVGWLGTSGTLVPLRGQRLRWTAALQGGDVDHVRASIRLDPTLAPATVAEDLRLAGRLASVRWEADVARRLSAGASFLYLSGDELPRRPPGSTSPLTGTFHGFVGVRPFVTATNLFFGGGLSESFAARQVSIPGVNGRGVVAPGLFAGWDPTDRLAVDVSGTWLRADAEGPFGGRTYGTELDLEVTWQPVRWLQLGAELDALLPGDFFPTDRTLTKAVLAVDVFTP